MNRQALNLTLAWTLILGLGGAAAAQVATLESAPQADELVPFDFCETCFADPTEPMVERTAPPLRLVATPGLKKVAEWAEDPRLGLRRMRLAKQDPAATGAFQGGARGPAAAGANVQAKAPDPTRFMAVLAAMGDLKGLAAITEARRKDPDSTNWIAGICATLACAAGARAGETVITTPDGGKVTHTYDQSKAIGSRNTIAGTEADGTSFSVTSSPLVLDLGGNGVRVSDRRLRYDIDGDGYDEEINDFSSTNGVLAVDSNGDGVSGGSGRELFGENTDLDGDGRRDGFRDGFEALLGLVRKAVAAKVLPGRVLEDMRLEAADLAALEKAYGLRVRLGGLAKKALAPRDAGVASLDLTDAPSRLVRDFDGQGNDVMYRDQAAFTRTDGSRGSYADIWFSFAKKAGSRLAPVAK